MDRSQRPPAGGPGGGSVRAARERMQAGLLPGAPQSQIPQPQYGNDSTRVYQQNPQAPRARQPMPAALSASRGDGQSVGAAISRPTQVPQWPLAGSIDNSNDQRQQFNQQSNYQPPSGRGQAPQRPPRPRNVPSMLDASKIQDHTPSFQYRAVGPQMDEDDIMSPDLKSPMSHASRPSTISSVGTIPDFPMPIPPQPALPGPPRRSANLGPPPSARRGASSYYSNASFVSPIPEESPRTNRSHGSYASSAAMPSRWEDNARADSYYEDDIYSEDQFSPGSPPASPPDHHEEANLVRSASFGRKGKPTVVTMGKGPEKVEPMKNYAPQTSNKLAKMGVLGPGAAALASASQRRPAPSTVQPEQRNTAWPMMGDVNSPLASGTGFIDSSSSSESVPKVARAITTNDKAAVPTQAPTAMDPRVSQILAATAAAAGTRSETPPNLDRSFSRLSAIRRPPKLDIDAVRDAEARGSLTSLPDLIRRATKLAAMMDKGKRPASRLALNDFSDEDLAREKEMSSGDEKRQSGLSGMLAAFPPPGLAGTPTRDSPGRPGSGWPSPMGADSTVQMNGRSEQPKRKRRCCGMPPWVFLLILFFTLVIIAAAVVVPLELLVFNKPKASTPLSALATCQANTTCANGGTTVIAAGLCSCLCSNGFTGSTCTTGGNASCATLNITSSASTTDANNALTYSNVTLGDAIPRLISAAQTNFSIPLASDTIIARLNAGNLSCGAENALVTFDGSATRVGEASSPATTTVSSGSKGRRDSIDTVSSPATDITTSNGGATPSLNPPAASTSIPEGILTATPTASAPSSASTDPTNISSTNFTITQERLDFARVAVLYILQVRDLETAVTSQGSLQKFLSFVSAGGSSAEAGNVTVADDAIVNFLDESVTVSGVKVGGKASTASRMRIRMRARGEDGAWALPSSAPVIVHTGWVVTPLENTAD